MDGATLADRLSRGLGAAARVFGVPYDAFRPRGAGNPLRAEFRFLRLPAAFDGGDPGYRRPRGYERAMRGTFDSAYLQVGDLLQGPLGVLFVAALPALNRPLCVLTNSVLRVDRPGGPDGAGLVAYGGVVASRLEPVLADWPGLLLPSSVGRPGPFPGDGTLDGFVLLLPLGAPGIRTADLVRDDTGRRFVAGGVELSELGWRVSLRQAGA